MYTREGSEARTFLEELASQGIRPSVIAYADGCSHPHFEPHNGGWGYVLLENKAFPDIDDILVEAYGYETRTTNNVMEMEAIYNALLWVPAHSSVEVRSDSQTAVTIMKTRRSTIDSLAAIAAKTRKLIAEKDLYVSYTHVKGHADDDFNNRADILSNLGVNTADIIYGIQRK